MNKYVKLVTIFTLATTEPTTGPQYEEDYMQSEQKITKQILSM